MTDYSFYEQKKRRLSRGAQAKIRGTRLVFGRRVDLELRVGSWRQSTRSAGNSFPAT